jgi:hypothetical protein
MSNKVLPETILKTFLKIVSFINRLNDALVPSEFSRDPNFPYHDISLYNHLLDKIKLSHKQSIKKHVELFGEFCNRNRTAILNQDPSSIVSPWITFSSKVRLNLGNILNDSNIDPQIKEACWQHLLVINSQLDPTSGAREVLQKLQSEGSKEGEFLQTFLTKVENSNTTIPPDTNPMTALGTIMKSGVMQELASGIHNGIQSEQLDVSKLFGAVQQMMMGAGQGGNLMNMMSSMMGNNGVMSAMTSMMGDKSSINPDKIKEVIEAKLDSEVKDGSKLESMD